MELNGEQLQLRYIPLDQVVLWDENPKKHNLGALMQSIQRYGYVDPGKFDPSININKVTGGLVYGNGRSICIKLIRDDPNRKGIPRGICVDKDGNWYLPVLFGVDAESEAVARALAIDHNNLTMAGGDFDMYDMAKMWNQAEYAKLLNTLHEQNIAPVTMESSDIEAYLRVMNSLVEGKAFDESIADGVVLEATFKIKLPADDANTFEQELDQLLAEFPQAKKEKVI